ncbi:hypothetical protein PO909_016627 [Leuciscus waleckii]
MLIYSFNLFHIFVINKTIQKSGIACLFRYNWLSFVYLIYLLLIPLFAEPTKTTMRGHTGRLLKSLCLTSVTFLLLHLIFQITINSLIEGDNIDLDFNLLEDGVNADVFPSRVFGAPDNPGSVPENRYSGEIQYYINHCKPTSGSSWERSIRQLGFERGEASLPSMHCSAIGITVIFCTNNGVQWTCSECLSTKDCDDADVLILAVDKQHV